MFNIRTHFHIPFSFVKAYWKWITWRYFHLSNDDRVKCIGMFTKQSNSAHPTECVHSYESHLSVFGKKKENFSLAGTEHRKWSKKEVGLSRAVCIRQNKSVANISIALLAVTQWMSVYLVMTIQIHTKKCVVCVDICWAVSFPSGFYCC